MATNQGMVGSQPHPNMPNVPPNYNNGLQPTVGQSRLDGGLLPVPGSFRPEVGGGHAPVRKVLHPVHPQNRPRLRSPRRSTWRRRGGHPRERTPLLLRNLPESERRRLERGGFFSGIRGSLRPQRQPVGRIQRRGDAHQQDSTMPPNQVISSNQQHGPVGPNFSSSSQPPLGQSHQNMPRVQTVGGSQTHGPSGVPSNFNVGPQPPVGHSQLQIIDSKVLRTGGQRVKVSLLRPLNAPPITDFKENVKKYLLIIYNSGDFKLHEIKPDKRLVEIEPVCGSHSRQSSSSNST